MDATKKMGRPELGPELKRKPIDVCLPPELVATLDRKAKASKTSRSRLVEEALRQMLGV